LVALREIEAGLLDKETLDRTLEEDVLMDGFSSSDSEVPETAE
jgi:DNA-directed RNA polymerase subunit omega